MPGYNKRSVERDFNYYDPPEKVRQYIEAPANYRRSGDRLDIRDKALQSLLYIAAARVVEITGGATKAGIIPGVQASQFYLTEDFLILRGLKNVKHKFILRGDTWQEITNWRDYPNRIEIPISRRGGLAWISKNIESHLETLRGNQDLFKIGPSRAYQIVNGRSGLFPHYFKDMGLKLWFRLYGKDPFQLKKFSGHKRWENLERYMQDQSQARANMLSWEAEP